MIARSRRRPRCERGVVAVELAVMAPVLVAFLLLVVFAGRWAHRESVVSSAAAEAARHASVERTPADAAASAESTAAGHLASCDAHSVSVSADVSPGGSVSVTVDCVVDMADLAFIGAPGSHTFSATAVEQVDVYRGVEP